MYVHLLFTLKASQPSFFDDRMLFIAFILARNDHKEVYVCSSWVSGDYNAVGAC